MAEDGTAWRVAEFVWRNLPDILERLKKVREWFRSSAGRDILIIGPGGVGKTTLAAILAGKFDWLLSEPWNYEESFGVDTEKLKDDPKVGIVIPPGQHSRREASWPSIERDLSAGRFRGVIVVSANGHHSIPTRSYKEHSLYQGSKESFLTAYFAACREQETAVLERVTTALRVATGKVWLMSVVAKEDLWWPGRDIEAFYSGGHYCEAVAKVLTAKGAEHFRHELVRVSLLICNLVSGGDMMVKNTEGYDHRMQITGVRRLFEALDALRVWEAAK